ncbi:hypothetical protein [Candidatus Viridilinea mediisalina]|uniref:CheW-like domain-containing protein n=1 Tax=Candidatus Viridilinea mediisalina TaxID=2024553 RepID=A0A2A6RGT0_9CHLR|nr:hypothetical protein [Candidatus Viridilinea mediisalina]PDW02334.1 hypothetical protein CJ255_14570 [Candidatus Viridilinea mediisalina]
MVQSSATIDTELPLLLEVQTAQRLYLVPRSHVDYLVKYASATLPERDARGRPVVGCELGALLDPSDLGLPPRNHALTVALRRRTVAMLVARVTNLTAPGPIQPLGPLLTPRLARPWLLGAVVIADSPVLVLDLRRIAADVALGVV